ncbi:MAG: DUF3574 domain-containing protein [Planctomycetes bacterium]|nr:DUF3574 domain-containing protein [Planctomycetota bacterium]
MKLQTYVPNRLLRVPLSGVAALLLALALVSCHSDQATRTQEAPAAAKASAAALPGKELLKTELYFGRGKPDGGVVSDAEWTDFLDKEVTPRFPDGLTVLDAQGQWRGEQGRVVKEPSKVLVLLHEDSAGTAKLLDELIAAYKKRFAQESVLRVTQRVHAAF